MGHHIFYECSLVSLSSTSFTSASGYVQRLLQNVEES